MTYRVNVGTPWNLASPLHIDRAAERRDSADLDACTAVVVHSGSVLTVDGALVEVSPLNRPDAELVVYLGRDGNRDLAAVVPRDPNVGRNDDGIGGERMVGLRDFLVSASGRGVDGAREREIASTAVALATWHANHPRCSVCGDVTVPTHGGWVRRCDRDGRDHFPRTDPAVIIAITDEEDRLLLAHAAYWSPRRFSHLAGYVEPGESFEQAAYREVREESGLDVTDLVYVASQPWPFPASVMVAFTGRVASTDIRVDGTEITEARFVSREELPGLISDEGIVVAPRGSIARRLMEDWFGGDIP